MRKIPLILEDTKKLVEGIEIYLKGLYEIGERGFTIQIVQGHLGQFITARTYLEKGYKVLMRTLSLFFGICSITFLISLKSTD